MPLKMKLATAKLIKPKLSERRRKRIDKRIDRKDAAIQRKTAKIDKKQNKRNQLAKELYDKYGQKDYERIRTDASFAASLPVGDRNKIRSINALAKSEARKYKSSRRKERKINKLLDKAYNKPKKARLYKMTKKDIKEDFLRGKHMMY